MATKTAKQRQLKSWDEVDEALGRLSRLEPTQKALEADLETEIARIKQRYAAEMEPLEKEIAPLVAAVGDFVMDHRDDLDEAGEKRSRQLQHGVVGLQYGRPALKTVGKRTWAKVVEQILDLPAALRRKCLRIKQDPDKEAIKAAIESGEIDEEQRRLLGVAVMREETAYYQLTSETTPRG
jgi:phage host-nuclease inhibitor protein Gam